MPTAGRLTVPSRRAKPGCPGDHSRWCTSVPRALPVSAKGLRYWRNEMVFPFWFGKANSLRPPSILNSRAIAASINSSSTWSEACFHPNRSLPIKSQPSPCHPDQREGSAVLARQSIVSLGSLPVGSLLFCVFCGSDDSSCQRIRFQQSSVSPTSNRSNLQNVGVHPCLLPSPAPLLRPSARILDLAANRRLPAGRQAGVETAKIGTIAHPADADPVTCWAGTEWFCSAPWPATSCSLSPW